MPDQNPAASIVAVRDIYDEAHGSRTVVFPVPDSWAAPYYLAGQYVTIRIAIDGATYVRSYSITSIPAEAPEEFAITVKVIEDGVVSQWINTGLRPGDEVEILPAAGAFIPRDDTRNVTLLAAGSGITPMKSLAAHLLGRGATNVTLFYSFRGQGSAIFLREMRLLAAAEPERFTFRECDTTQRERVSASDVDGILAGQRADQYFVCGPEAFTSFIVDTLKAHGIERSDIRTETYSSLTDADFVVPSLADAIAATPGQAPVALRVTMFGKKYQLHWPRDTKLLDTLLDSKIRAPYSCREGRCSSCMCALVSGQVRMANNEALSDADLAEGLILACQSFAINDDDIVIDYDF